MNLYRGVLLAAAVSMLLVACHFPGGGKPPAPTGQVVAKVGDREITLRELQAEMGNASPSDPKARKAAEQVALSNIGRIILADAARAQGIDKTPDFDIDRKRALDNLLAQELQQKLAARTPPPSRLEAQDFVNAHPDIFAERKVFTVDQIRMARPSDPSLLKTLEPLKTLEQVEAALTAAKIPYQRSGGTLDAVGADPRLVEEILKLPPNEVFVIPGGTGLLVNQVRETRVIPFIGDQAVDYALQYLTRQRAQESVQKAINELLAAQAGKVQFNKDYAPQKPPGQAAAKALATEPPANQVERP
jgi:EpsD family peptidyl-prolyl cis-trans isomerase